MEKLLDLLRKISSLPMIGKILSLVAIVITLVVILFFTASCGASRSTVRVMNRAEGTTTTVSMTNGNGGNTTVTVSPEIHVDSTKIL